MSWIFLQIANKEDIKLYQQAKNVCVGSNGKD